MMILALDTGAKLCKELEETSAYQKCLDGIEKLKQYHPDYNGSKQAAALMALAGLVDKATINQTILSKDGSKNISTFLGS